MIEAARRRLLSHREQLLCIDGEIVSLQANLENQREAGAMITAIVGELTGWLEENDPEFREWLGANAYGAKL